MPSPLRGYFRLSRESHKRLLGIRSPDLLPCQPHFTPCFPNSAPRDYVLPRRWQIYHHSIKTRRCATNEFHPQERNSKCVLRDSWWMPNRLSPFWKSGTKSEDVSDRSPWQPFTVVQFPLLWVFLCLSLSVSPLFILKSFP